MRYPTLPLVATGAFLLLSSVVASPVGLVVRPGRVVPNPETDNTDKTGAVANIDAAQGGKSKEGH